jgi:hypothetical protein
MSGAEKKVAIGCAVTRGQVLVQHVRPDYVSAKKRAGPKPATLRIRRLRHQDCRGLRCALYVAQSPAINGWRARTRNRVSAGPVRFTLGARRVSRATGCVLLRVNG